MILLISTYIKNNFKSIMDYRFFNEICGFLPTPGKLLSCCKKLTVKRVRDIRWRNRIYYKDNRTKIVNCKYISKIDMFGAIKYFYKEIWYKEGKEHRDDIDLKTGLTLPAKIDRNETKYWCKNGKYHCDDIDPKTGRTHPTQIEPDCSKVWHIYDKNNQNSIDIETIDYITWNAKTNFWEID